MFNLKSTSQTYFPNLDNRKMARQVFSHFLYRAQYFAIEYVNRFAIRDSDNQNSLVLGRRKIEDIGEAHIAGDNQPVFPLGIIEYDRIAFATQADITHIYCVKTRATENAGGGTRNIFVSNES